MLRGELSESVRDFFELHPCVQTVFELFDALPSVFFYAKDSKHRYVAVNRRNLSDVFGLKRVEDLLGRTDAEFQSPAFAEAYHAEDRRVMEEKRTIPNQVWLVPAVRGMLRWYVSTKTPLFCPRGSVIGIAGVMYPVDTPEEQASLFRELLPAIDYIDSHYTESISIRDLAEISGRSTTQFNCRFRKILRMSPTEYILARRVQRAQHLLEESTSSIAEVGAAVGFFDQSHFTKRFRKATGMTPLEYRKRFRGGSFAK